MTEENRAIRHSTLSAAGVTIPLPCFSPSVSSIKTNLLPVDYIEFLSASGHPLFLVSAFDIGNSSEEHRTRINSALMACKNKGTAILMDSGNYERFWKAQSWEANQFHEISQASAHHLAFCYDNQEPPQTAEAIAADVIAGVLRDQKHSIGTIVPIVHGSTELLPLAAQITAKELYPILLAVPERALGDGIAARTKTVRKIRKALNGAGFYCPLHLLGTGNPISMIAYAFAGADSFDGLEWCQTVVNHKTGVLYHFQQWDLFRDQTGWGTNGNLPYNQSVLMHNLIFFNRFMEELRVAVKEEKPKDLLEKYLPVEKSETILRMLNGSD